MMSFLILNAGRVEFETILYRVNLYCPMVLRGRVTNMIETDRAYHLGDIRM